VARVRFEHIWKLFGSNPVVEDLDLEVADGEFLALVGPSGCGKTTSLRMLAGLERPTYGRLHIADEVVNNLPSRSRNVAMVFQNYALFPHLSVFDNVAFGMRVRREPNVEARVREVAELLGITALLSRRPESLSGGERQRVALGRAMIRRPRVFLMDEPLSNLDAALRVQMRVEIGRVHSLMETTTVYVTHDQVEAMTMGDRIAVMSEGRLQQVDTPEAVYDRPANLFVATFIGSPRMNLIGGTLEASETRTVIRVFDRPIELAWRIEGMSTESRDVLVGFRPEDTTWVTGGRRTADSIRGVVEIVEPLGAETFVRMRVGDLPITVRVPARSGIRAKDSIDIELVPARIHVFDPATGLAITPPSAGASDKVLSATRSGAADG